MDTISFARGAPSVDIVDVDGLREAANEAFTNDPAGLAAYGTAVGYKPLREWIAGQHDLPPEQVVVTNGSMQADAFLFDLLVEPRQCVVIERPTYDRTLLSLRERGADLHAVDLDGEGIDVDALERALEGGLRPRLAHVIPNFQNPAGHTLSLERRRKLLALAGAYDFLIFEDDPYRHIRFRGETLPTMLELDEHERVVHASSFSKTICPGIRIGYLAGPEPLIADVVRKATGTYIAPNMVAEGIAYRFCASGRVDQSIATVRDALRDRVDALASGLREHLPEATFLAPDGGYFLWVDMPEGTDVDALFAAAKERGVAIVKGSDFVIDGGHSSFRLAYSGVTVEQIGEGVKRLAEAAHSVG